MQNVILYLIGFPGVGKLTTAREFQKQEPSFKLIDNHIPANLIFCFSDAADDPRHLAYRTQARRLMLEAMAELARPEDSFIFTNVLYAGENDWYDDIEQMARKRKALFVPVILICSAQENKRRIVSSERREKLKTTDAACVDCAEAAGMIAFDHPHKQVIDNTFLSASETAQKIRQIILNLKGRV